MIIDAHVHCGIQDTVPPQGLQDYLNASSGSGITGAVMFPPVAEIYDRYDYNFEDTAYWQQRRQRGNEYLLFLDSKDFRVFPYLFIWNDFAVDQLTSQHKGIKWHRHDDEPEYHYVSELCAHAVEEIRRRDMPVVLEEELENTMRFIQEIAVGVKVIIPHLGGLNGGYQAIKENGLWDLPNVYADTALAATFEIKDYIKRYGVERLFFGSDFPFGDPKKELQKVLNLKLSEPEKERLVAGNILDVMATSNPERQTP